IWYRWLAGNHWLYMLSRGCEAELTRNVESEGATPVPRPAPPPATLARGLARSRWRRSTGKTIIDCLPQVLEVALRADVAELVDARDLKSHDPPVFEGHFLKT